MDKNAIPKATLGRLPMYLEFLTKLPAEQTPYISATTIAKKLCLGDVQVRKDLNRVSGAGRPKVGYVTADLIYSIEIEHSAVGEVDYHLDILPIS